MKNLLIYSVTLFTSLLLTNCGDDDGGDMMLEPTQNIVELAQQNGFTSLAAALTKAGLVDELQAAGSFTVFAPTNAAFDALLAEIGQTSIDDVPAAVLQQILLYHVVPTAAFSSDITAGNLSTLEGTTVDVGTADGIAVNGASVVAPFDVEATNGVIHTVDAVLVPASVGQFVNTVLEPAYFNENFTTLVAAVVKGNLVDALLNTADLTIFAPTNDAFTASGIDIDALGADVLANVLTYHVVGAKVLSSGIPREAATLNGENIYFSLVAAGNFVNGNTEIVAVDIESGSGVVHVIDQVLLPPVGNLVETAIGLTADGEFTSLVAALQRTTDEGTTDQDLLAVLSGTGPFTVFAPTNAAFQALLDSNSDWNSLTDIPLETLVSVLTYHVVPARAYDKDLSGAINSDNELSTAQGNNLVFDLTNLSINTEVGIIGVNTNATNGVIHVIDNVLVPVN
jgi:transforming growth factor-beta-induced protein